MTVVFVIVTYNGSQWIRDCLKSIPVSSDHKVVVVDNASTDDTCEIITADFPAVDLLPSHDNLGFGRANNLAIRHALGKHEPDAFFLLNQDARLGPHRHVEHLDHGDRLP